MFLKLDGKALVNAEKDGDLLGFIINEAKTDPTMKDIIEAGEAQGKPYKAYAHIMDAGMTGTNTISFYLTNDTPDSFIEHYSQDLLQSHVEQYSCHWHGEDYDEDLQSHLDSASNYVEEYSAVEHNRKIGGYNGSVQFELLY